MIFTKELLLKGLAGVSLCAGVAGVGIHIYKSGEVKITDPRGQLGLPADCALPKAGASTSCTIENANISKINDIKFDGKNNTAPTLTGTGSLRITIAKSDDTNFPHGYKFTLTPSGGNLTINRGNAPGGNIVINNGKSSDFKVKKTKDGFALEEAFTLNTLINKLADFTCTNGECQIGTATAISIKQGEHTESKIKAASQSETPGKIKVYSGEADYNKGFKFVIEEGDIALTGDTGGTNISKLEEFETYEIKKESNGWVLVRKTKASEVIKKALGLNEGTCNLPESTSPSDCPIDREKIATIKFEGMGEGVASLEGDSSNMKLKIHKTTDKTAFPYGFKFILESDKDITIPQGSNSTITIKKNTNTEFKIKKTGEGKSAVLTLEKAWTVGELAKKVKLTECTTEGTKECNFGDSISVYHDNTNKVVDAAISGSGKKIRYLDKEGYNQGIKFYIPHSEADITITGTATGTGVTTISKETTEGAGPSYEIKEMDGTWYLVKKNS